MAKIELYKNKINNMPNIINNVRAEVSSYATALTKLYSKILAIDSPVVDKAIASLSTATKIQEEQIMRCDSDSGKKLIKSMVLRTADRQGMC